MSPLAIGLILLSAAIHVGWNALTKSSANPRVFAFLKNGVLTLVAIALLPILPLSVLSKTVWICIILSGIIHFVYIFSLSMYYKLVLNYKYVSIYGSENGRVGVL